MFFGKKEQEKKEDVDLSKYLAFIKGQLNKRDLSTRRELSELHTHFEKAPFIYTTINSDFEVLNYNNTLLEYTGLNAVDGITFKNIIHSDDVYVLEQKIKEARRLGDTKALIRLNSQKDVFRLIEWDIIEIDSNVSFVLFGRDVTEVNNEIDKLRKSLHLNKIIIECLPISIISVDKNGFVLYMNGTTLSDFNINESEISSGKHIYELLGDMISYDNFESPQSITLPSGEMLEILNTPMFDGNNLYGYNLTYKK